MKGAELSRRGLLGGFGRAAAVAVVAPAEATALAVAVTEPARAVTSAVGALPDLDLVKEAGVEVGARYQDFIHSLEVIREIKESKSTVAGFMSGPVSGPMDLKFYSRICSWRNTLRLMEREGSSLKDIKDNLGHIRKLHDSKRNGVMFYHEDFWNIDEAENMMTEVFGNVSITDTVKAIENRVVDKTLAHLEYLKTIPVEEAYHQFPAWYEDVVREWDKKGPRYERMRELDKVLYEKQLERKKEKIAEQERRYETAARVILSCRIEPVDLTKEELDNAPLIDARIRRENKDRKNPYKGAKAFLASLNDDERGRLTVGDVDRTIHRDNSLLASGQDYVLRQSGWNAVRIVTNHLGLIDKYDRIRQIVFAVRHTRPFSQAPDYQTFRARFQP